MSFDSKTLAQLKERLATEKIRIEEELNRIAKPTTASGDFSTNFSEIGTDDDANASEVEEYTDNLAVEKTLEKQLKDILSALKKMETGEYGKCENCANEISVERLMAYPAAKTCVNC